ncbi:MAG: glycoside hydrolase, partial [Candidatus Eremiobacteraeota bacterium]|nr:glycoside hydrolase [Candidatus Eremiobacteraeota bacterium]
MHAVRTAIVAAFALALTPLVSYAQSIPLSAYAQLHWRMIGPFRGGRTVAVTGVPQQPGVFYIAAVNGGIWKSTDYGHTWKAIFDDNKSSGSIGALAVAPSDPNIIYAGSGEGLRRPDLAVGDGIYKSSDAGAHWTHLGLRDGRQINGIAVDPRDPNRVFAAVVGHPYGPNAERGLYRSIDGGATWTRVLGRDENTGAVAVTIDPVHPDTMYAALWASRVGPWHFLQIYELAQNNGLYKSTDAGATWTKLTRGLPEKPGRIGMSVSAAKDNVVYAIVDASSGCGIYRSDDAGASWQKTNDEERVCGRGGDFGNVTADPKDAMTVYVPNTTTYRSTNGGKTFVGIKGAPGGDDYHTVWIDPQNANIVLLGSDQGATLSVNRGETWSSWYNQPTAQFYHVITDNRFPYWVYGGQQESGSAGVVSRSDYGAISFRDWHTVGAEEYGYVAPDPLHPGVIYGGKASRFDERTGDVQDVSPTYDRKKYRFNRTMPLIFNRVDPHVLYLGSQVIFETRNDGHSWRIISPDLTRKQPGTPPNMGPFADADKLKNQHRGVVYSISPSYIDRNLIWAGTDDGLIWVTRDAGTHWSNVTPAAMSPWSKVSQIDASHFDRATVHVSINRLRLDDNRPFIYRTHDGGKTWQQIANGIGNEPVNAVREDPKRRGLLYAATERSVYFSLDDGNHWQALQNNLPPTSVRDVVVKDNDLVAGTHGRSFWILDAVSPLRELRTSTLPQRAHLFAP